MEQVMLNERVDAEIWQEHLLSKDHFDSPST
jgi:hypothetical protein